MPFWRRKPARVVLQDAAAPAPGRVLGEVTVSLPSAGSQERMSSDFIEGWIGSIHTTDGHNGIFPYQLAVSPAAWRGATLLAALMGALKWRTYLEDEDPTKPDVEIRTPECIRKPDPYRTAYTTYSSWALDYLLSGNAMAVVGPRDAMGMPTSLLPFYSAYATVQYVDPSAQPFLQPASGRLYTIGSDQFTDVQILHVMGPAAPGGLRGMAVFEVLCEHRKLWSNLNKQAQDAAAIDNVPPAIIFDKAPDADPDDVAALKAGWNAAASSGSRQPAFTNGQIGVEVVAWNPSELQLLEARQFSLTEIALALGLPLHFVAATPEGGLTYSTTALEADDLLKFGKPAEMIPAFEQALSDLLPPGMYVKADATDLLRMAPGERSAFYAAALSGGWMTVDEVRAEENLPPLTTGPEPDPAVQQALVLAQAAPSLMEAPGLVALVAAIKSVMGQAPGSPMDEES